MNKVYLTDEELMTKVADIIAQEENEKIAKIEDTIATLDIAPDPKVLALAREYDAKHKNLKLMPNENTKSKRLAFKRTSRVACLFLICIIVIGGITIGTSSAFRIKLFDIFVKHNDGGVVMRDENEYELIGNWTDYWYPTYMPKGFTLEDAGNVGGKKLMMYSNEETGKRIRISINNELLYDSDVDTTKMEQVDIGYYKGYIFIENKDKVINLIWQTENATIKIATVNYLDRDEIVKVAQNLKFVE